MTNTINSGEFSVAPTGTVGGVYTNTIKDIIVTDEDKLRLALIQHTRVVESKYGWITPLSIFLTVSATLATSTFKAALGLPAPTWQAIFVIADILSLLASLKAGVDSYRTPKIDDLIKTIKGTDNGDRTNQAAGPSSGH